MSFRVGTNWCHDFPKVARDSGFHFNTHRARVRVDWKRIGSIDVERVIGERDFKTIDENVDDIVDCCLESEYDVKILDPNFVKLFRLAQLAVEYLLYCKQYLDRSVVILKDELRSKLEENVRLRKEVDVQDARSKERSRFLEKKCNDSHGEIHKCPHCPKTFVSEPFVRAHVDRRHPHLQPRSSSDSSPAHKRYLAEAERLHEEIKTLKERLNQTERVIRNKSEKETDDGEEDGEKGSGDGRLGEGKKTRDRDEKRYRGYREEIRHFKATLLSEIRNLKLAETTHREKEDTDDWSGEDVKELVRRQEKEIRRLRDQLQKRLTPDIEGIHAKLDNQEDFWQSKIDNLETRHRIDMEKLYSQLKVSRESVNEMRLDCMSKINDLEWRSRSESAVLSDPRDKSDKFSSTATRIENVGDTSEVRRLSIGNSRDNDCSTRGMRRRRDDERIRDESTRKIDNISEVEDKAYRGNTTIPISSLSLKNPDTNKSVETPMAKDEDRNGRRNRSEDPKIDTDKSLRGEFHESLGYERRPSNIDKSITREAVERQDTSSLDSGDCTTTTNASTAAARKTVRMYDTSSETVLSEIHDTKKKFLIADMPSRVNGPSVGRASRGDVHVEKSNDSVVEASCVSSSEESLDNSEATVESRTEDTDENGKIRNNGRSEIDENDLAKEDSGQASVEQVFESKLRDLGIDPEWQAIPNGTFAQIMETIGHDRKLNCKKYHKFEEIRHKLIQQVARALSIEEKVARIDYSPKRSPLEKLMTNVKSRASKALRILEKNEGSRRSVNPASQRSKDTRPERSTSNNIKPLRRAAHRISEQGIQEGHRPRAAPRKTIVDNDSVDSAGDLKHSYESIKDFVRDPNRKLVTSTPQRNERKLMIDAASFVNDASARVVSRRDSLSGSPRNNSRGVLKSTSFTGGNHVKKKVLFHLEDETSPESGEEKEEESEDEEEEEEEEKEKEEEEEEEDQEEEDEEQEKEKHLLVSEANNQAKKDRRPSLFDISSIYDSRDVADREIRVSPQSGSIVLKTRQSEKIARISKQIEKQLSVPREKPVGAVEAIFMDKSSLGGDNEESREANTCRRDNDAPAKKLENDTRSDKKIPRAALRFSHYCTSESNDSNLDMDIDELLEIQ